MKHRKTFIQLEEELNINNSDQWVLVRGKNVDAPLLIHVQAGPPQSVLWQPQKSFSNN